eukprot:COSAG05_NODE_933_length_6538_cov_16.519646_9_plen_55_part_00
MGYGRDKVRPASAFWLLTQTHHDFPPVYPMTFYVHAVVPRIGAQYSHNVVGFVG